MERKIGKLDWELGTKKDMLVGCFSFLFLHIFGLGAIDTSPLKYQ